MPKVRYGEKWRKMKILLTQHSEIHALLHEVCHAWGSDERYATVGMYPYHIQRIQRS